MTEYQVVIVGGGPAGLSAALLMGRGRTRALVCDTGSARHLVAPEAHSFLTRDGTPPAELRRIGREQLEPYETIEFRHAEVTSIEQRPEGGFRVSAEGQPAIDAQFVLLATGIVDIHLEIPGYMDFWGKSLVHCPYCHGWEFRDRPLGVLAPTPDTLDMGPLLTHWSKDVIVFAQAELEIPEELASRMEAKHVAVERRSVRRIVGSSNSGMIEAVELEDGARIPRAALYYRPKQRPSDFVQDLGPGLGTRFTEEGFVEVDEWQRTSVAGLYAAGDLTTARQQIVVAAAHGFTAALAIERALKGM